jgi:hypothetical protein
LTAAVPVGHSEPQSGGDGIRIPLSPPKFFEEKFWRDLALAKFNFDKADPPRMA